MATPEIRSARCVPRGAPPFVPHTSSAHTSRALSRLRKPSEYHGGSRSEGKEKDANLEGTLDRLRGALTDRRAERCDETCGHGSSSEKDDIVSLPDSVRRSSLSSGFVLLDAADLDLEGRSTPAAGDCLRWDGSKFVLTPTDVALYTLGGGNSLVVGSGRGSRLVLKNILAGRGISLEDDGKTLFFRKSIPAFLEDVRPPGVNGGKAPKLSEWFPREMPCLRAGDTNVHLQTNQRRFDVEAGSFLISAEAAAYTSGQSYHQLRLWSVTRSEAVLNGPVVWSNGACSQSYAHLRGVVEVHQDLETFELQQRIDFLEPRAAVNAHTTLGRATELGPEIYAQIVVEEL